MDKASVIAFAQCIGTKVESVSSQGWAQMRCPLAPFLHDSGRDSNPSAAIKVVPGGLSRFTCFTCENHDLLSLLHRLKELGAQAPKYRFKDALALVAVEDEQELALTVKDYDAPAGAEHDDGNNDALFSEDWLASFVRAPKVEAAMAYLTSRGLDLHTITDLDVRWDSSRGTVCFPIRDLYGRLCGLRGRRVAPTGDLPAYHMYKTAEGPTGRYNRLVWLGEHRVDFNRPVLMVESVFDYAAVYPWYENVVAPLTVGMGPRKVKRMAPATDIVTLFDTGAGGDKARKLIDKHLPSNGRVHLVPTGRHRFDPERKAKDPGEMRPASLITLLNDHLPMEDSPLHKT